MKVRIIMVNPHDTQKCTGVTFNANNLDDAAETIYFYVKASCRIVRVFIGE